MREQKKSKELNEENKNKGLCTRENFLKQLPSLGCRQRPTRTLMKFQIGSIRCDDEFPRALVKNAFSRWQHLVLVVANEFILRRLLVLEVIIMRVQSLNLHILTVLQESNGIKLV